MLHHQVLTSLLTSSLSFASLAAQCPNAWAPLGVAPGTDAPVSASTLWDPDGPGPARAHVVVAGSFTAIGTMTAPQFAMQDPATGVWSALGSPVDGTVLSLAVGAQGSLLAGGRFAPTGSSQPWCLARLSGATWINESPGLGTTECLLQVPNGDLIAGGQFRLVGSTVDDHILRWNGTNWSRLGLGVGGPVTALARLANGDLVAGWKSMAMGVPMAQISRWDGNAWTLIASHAQYSEVLAMVELPGGRLIAGGNFPFGSPLQMHAVLEWNGTTWSPLLASNGEEARALAVMPDGSLLAGGSEYPNGAWVARWNGTAWSQPAGGIRGLEVATLCVLPSGEFVAGGNFGGAGTVSAKHLARWTGAAWQPMVTGGGLDQGVMAMASTRDGDLVVGGYFEGCGGIAARGVARLRGSSWSPIDSPLPLQGTLPRVLLPLPDGSLVMGGYFLLHRWDGFSWLPLGQIDDEVVALAHLPNGDLVAGGYLASIGGVPASGLARWNGTTWTPMSGWQRVFSLATDEQGQLIASGIPAVGNTSIARWNGVSWVPLGTGLVGIATSLAFLPDGDLLACGQVAVQGGTQRVDVVLWNGSTWTSLGLDATRPGHGAWVNSIVALPNGDVVAGGQFSHVAGQPMNGLARWDGTSWSPLGSGIDGTVYALAFAGDTLFVGGTFSTAGGAASHHLAALVTTCPARVASLASGCATGSSHSLTTALAWTGGRWWAETTGPATTGAVAVFGFASASVPLPWLFAGGQPGCALRVYPDSVHFVSGDGVRATVNVVLPNSSALAGLSFHHQMLPLMGSSTLTATDAVTLTVGTF
jgi:hypothetical protein